MLPAPLRTVCLAPLLLAACDSETRVTPAAPAPTPLSLAFELRAGNDPVRCDSPAADMGAAGDRELQLRDLRFYVSNLRLVRPSGAEARVTLAANAWQTTQGGDSIALLDFVDLSARCSGTARATRTVITGTVPSGTYTGVRFELGVPEYPNHGDVTALPPPLDIADLFRDAEAGRWFLRAETEDTGNALLTQQVAIASGGCVSPGNPQLTLCSQPWRPTVTLTGYTGSGSVVVADLRALFAEADLSMPLSCTPAGSADCVAIASRLGLDASGQPDGSQAFFRLE